MLTNKIIRELKTNDPHTRTNEGDKFDSNGVYFCNTSIQ